MCKVQEEGRGLRRLPEEVTFILSLEGVFNQHLLSFCPVPRTGIRAVNKMDSSPPAPWVTDHHGPISEALGRLVVKG